MASTTATTPTSKISSRKAARTFPVPNNPRRQQYFSIWIRPVPADKAVFALRAALWELDRLVENGMSR